MMILVDTSVWVDHFRGNEDLLINLLVQNKVLGHSFVRSELALGNLKQRKTILTALDDLPQAPEVHNDEINYFIERNTLYGQGIGLIDVHLLASTLLYGNARLWTRDKRLLAVTTWLNLSAAVEILN